MKFLVTGSAGFIGAALSARLLDDGHDVLGIDCLNDYYDVSLKQARLDPLLARARYSHSYDDIALEQSLETAADGFQPDVFVHLAAQAGVRYSIENPEAYVQSNLVGFARVLETCRLCPVKHLVYASTSSVYGDQKESPQKEEDATDNPVSFYAATKKSNEVMAASYADLHGIPTTGLRFFTVYGPWGRPDMALFKFTRAILADEEIEVYNNGNLERDFTYIDDIIEGVVRVCGINAGARPVGARHDILNIGRGEPVKLMAFISALETALGKPAKKAFRPMQAGDVHSTYCSVDKLTRETGFHPAISIEEGVARFVDWYKGYYAGQSD